MGGDGGGWWLGIGQEEVGWDPGGAVDTRRHKAGWECACTSPSSWQLSESGDLLFQGRKKSVHSSDSSNKARCFSRGHMERTCTGLTRAEFRVCFWSGMEGCVQRREPCQWEKIQPTLCDSSLHVCSTLACLHFSLRWIVAPPTAVLRPPRTCSYLSAYGPAFLVLFKFYYYYFLI